MNDATDTPTIGQEFASRWMEKHNLPRQHQGKEESFSRDVADVIDSFVSSKRDELRPLMREVVMEAVEGDSNSYRETTIEGQTASVSAKELLKSHELVFVANKYNLGRVQTWEFPV